MPPLFAYTGTLDGVKPEPGWARDEKAVLERLAELTGMYGSYGAAWIMWGEGAV